MKCIRGHGHPAAERREGAELDAGRKEPVKRLLTVGKAGVVLIGLPVGDFFRGIGVVARAVDFFAHGILRIIKVIVICRFGRGKPGQLPPFITRYRA